MRFFVTTCLGLSLAAQVFAAPGPRGVLTKRPTPAAQEAVLQNSAAPATRQVPSGTGDARYDYAMKMYEYWRGLYDDNPDKAQPYFERTFNLLYGLLQRNLRDVHSLVRTADMYRANHECKKALPLLTDVASKVYAEFPGTQYERTILIAFADCEEDNDKALGFYRRALNNAPGDAVTGVAMANRLLRAGSLPEADAAARLALTEFEGKLDRYSKAEAHHVLGWVAYHGGLYEAALDSFEQAKALRGKNPMDLEGLAWAYKAVGDEAKSKEAFFRLKLSMESDLGLRKRLSQESLRAMNVRPNYPDGPAKVIRDRENAKETKEGGGLNSTILGKPDSQR